MDTFDQNTIFESTGGLGAMAMDLLPTPSAPTGALSLPGGGNPVLQQMQATATPQSTLRVSNTHVALIPTAPLPPLPPARTQETVWQPTQPVGSEWWHYALYALVGAACGCAMAPSSGDRMKWAGIGAVAGGVGQGLGLGVAGYFALREKDGD